jgi:hypothetical protein
MTDDQAGPAGRGALPHRASLAVPADRRQARIRVRWHSERRVLLNGHSTVVFR